MNKKNLVQNSKKLFFTYGYHNVRVSDICEASSLSKGTFYYYFNHKSNLIDLFTEEFINDIKKLLSNIDTKINNYDKLINILDTLSTYAKSNSKLLYFLTVNIGESELNKNLQFTYSPLNSMVAKIIFGDQSEISIFKSKIILSLTAVYIKDVVLFKNSDNEKKKNLFVLSMISTIETSYDNYQRN